MSEATPSTSQRCAIVAIVGAPNAGKSTLVNKLVGQKIAAVTHKAQTTRSPLRGVAMRGDVQLILVDTPGVFAPKRRLDRAMVRAAFASVEDADAVVHLVDAGSSYLRPDVARIEEKLRGRKSILAINKVDSVARESLLALTKELTAGDLYTDVFMISALNGSGVEDLANHLAAKAPEGPWLFPADQAADAPSRVLAAEITREKLMLRLHDEVPYEATVETEAWEEKKDGSVRIEQTIYVARESQRRIAIGEKGHVVKTIGELARHELEAMFERRVHLFLHVKLRENWSEERARYNALGLDFDV